MHTRADHQPLAEAERVGLGLLDDLDVLDERDAAPRVELPDERERIGLLRRPEQVLADLRQNGTATLINVRVTRPGGRECRNKECADDGCVYMYTQALA